MWACANTHECTHVAHVKRAPQPWHPHFKLHEQDSVAGKPLMHASPSQRLEMTELLKAREPGLVHVFANSVGGTGVRQIRDKAIGLLKHLSPRLFVAESSRFERQLSAEAMSIAKAAAIATELPRSSTLPLVMIVAGAPNTGAPCAAPLCDSITKLL